MQLKAGFTTNDPRLDRIPQFDEQSKSFPIRALLPEKPRRSYTWSLPLQLDQGTEGACTGFSVAMEALARPWPVKLGDVNQANQIARQIYKRAQQLDEWPGEAYEGSSVLGATKAAIELFDWYTEYRWALGPGPEAAENDLALAVGYKGPAVLGTNWYTGMFRPNSDGFLRVTGRAEGGHAYVTNKYSLKRRAYWVPNSWGGQGQGWISEPDMIRLLDEQGEAMIPVKRSLGRSYT